MAKNLSTTFSIDMSSVVTGAINSVRNVRRSEQSRREAEFQRAIADGLSYSEQIKIREQQLEEERSSRFGADPDYIAELEKTISKTKELNRFNKYRTKYAATFTELVAGRLNEQRYLDVLKEQLVGVSDPELLLEIQKNIASAEDGLKTYNDTILANKVKLAQNDGSVKAIASIIAQVTIARSKALMDDKQDDVSTYDLTLAALNSQLASIRIEDAMSDFQANSAVKGTNALEKLDFMNEQIRSADPNSPIRISDGSGGTKTYASAREFWSVTRDNYLAGSFFKELDANIKNNVLANTKVAGISQAILDDTIRIFNDLKAKPELAPFMTQIEASQNATMNGLVEKFADRWITAAGITGDFAQASQQIAAAGTRYGVDTTSFVETLLAKAASLIGEEAEKEVVAEQPPFKAEVIGEPPSEITPPVPEKPTTTAPATFVPPTTTPAPATTEPKPTPSTTTTPVAQPTLIPPATPPTATTPLGEVFVGVKPPLTVPVAATPLATVPTPAPTPASTPATYSGTSIVDYLKTTGQDSSFASRAKLAADKGISGYEGTAEQNTKLLKILRG